MGNITFIIPTENKENFNIDYIKEQLENEFSEDLTFEKNKRFNNIKVGFKGEPVVTLHFNMKCYIVEYDEDIKELKENIKESINNKYFWERVLDEYLKFMNSKPDLNNCLQFKHPQLEDDYNRAKEIERFLHKLFKAYILDEGIHPELITPEYKFKKS